MPVSVRNMPTSLTVCPNTKVIHNLSVSCRPLATPGLQTITTPVALGSSFISTTWRVESCEGIRHHDSFFSAVFWRVLQLCFIRSLLWFRHSCFLVEPSTTAKLHFCLMSLSWCGVLVVSQGRHRKIPTGKVSCGIQRQQWEVDRRCWQNRQSTL